MSQIYISLNIWALSNMVLIVSDLMYKNCEILCKDENTCGIKDIQEFSD